MICRTYRILLAKIKSRRIYLLKKMNVYGVRNWCTKSEKNNKPFSVSISLERNGQTGTRKRYNLLAEVDKSN